VGNVPDVSMLAGQEHQGHQGAAHQQEERRQELNIVKITISATTIWEKVKGGLRNEM
jgi:hypothetical protein